MKCNIIEVLSFKKNITGQNPTTIALHRITDDSYIPIKNTTRQADAVLPSSAVLPFTMLTLGGILGIVTD